MIIECVEFEELIDTNGSDGAESVVLFELRNTMFETIFLDFLPEFNTSVIGRGGRSLNGNGLFLGLGEDENKNGTGD